MGLATTRNIRLDLAYDGTHYHGWQIQPDLPTVGGTLKEAISRLTGEDPKIIAASRIDAGAHALNQVVNFKTTSSLPISSFPSTLNSLLPDDIVVYSAHEVEEGFHARFSSKRRIYEYLILNSLYPSPIYRNHAFWIKDPIDLRWMKKARRAFIGTHDFTSFTNSLRKNPVRTIYRVEIYKRGDFIRIRIEGDAFLPMMVRKMVGALLEVGMKRIPPGRIKEILEAKENSLCQRTVPARGLYLARVEY
jgi:tRNA pseudouridine38-40 synthase